MSKNRIVVAGGGVFGTAMAERLAWNTDNSVVIHSIEKEVVETINSQHRNVKYFPTRFLNMNLSASSDYSVFSDADAVFLVIPSKAIVSFSQEMKKYTGSNEPLIINEWVDASLLVVKQNEATLTLINETITRIVQAKNNLIGCIYNSSVADLSRNRKIYGYRYGYNRYSRR